MNFFNFDIRKIIVLGLLLSIPIFSITMQQNAKDDPWIFKPFFFMAGITQNAFSSLTSGVRSTADLYLNLIDIKRENRRLTQEIAELKAQLSQMTELHHENERLNKLLEFRQRTKMDLLAAKIIGRDLFPDYDTVTINRGASHGVKKGMATITIAGVVGYAVQVEPYTSKILLLTDRYAAIDAIVQRSRARGIVVGNQKNSCSLNYLKRDDDVQIGDKVVTSGLDNIFPKGFPIGVVTTIEKDDYGLGQKIEIQPVVNSSNLEEVFVVLNAHNQDFENLAAQAAQATSTDANLGEPKGP